MVHNTRPSNCVDSTFIIFESGESDSDKFGKSGESRRPEQLRPAGPSDPPTGSGEVLVGGAPDGSNVIAPKSQVC